MSVRKKLAIFDFCGTIYKNQSADIFVDFAAPNNFRNQILQKICSYLATKAKYNGIIHKKVKLLKLQGLSLNFLQEKAKLFVTQIILNDLIDKVAIELDNYCAHPEYDVMIASAGYNIYLEYYCKMKNIPLLVATDIEIKNNKATGKISGYDCFGYQKQVKINKIINLKDYDLENSVCFSDSLTDKPIFSMAGKKYFIKNEKDNYSIIHISNEVFSIL